MWGIHKLLDVFQICIETSQPRAATEADRQLACPDKVLASTGTKRMPER